MKTLLLFALTLIILTSSFSQEIMKVAGAITIENSTNETPARGTIRWSGTDFEGWNGVIWVSMTGKKSSGTVTDIDGNVYNTIRIGNAEWMTENLKTSRYREGTPIELAVTDGRWSTDGNPYYCFYNNDPSNDAIYGKLYNWYAIENSAGLCPTDWYIPYNVSYEDMRVVLGNLYAGGKMKTTGTEHWESPNIGATNLSGFSGLPGGYRFQTGGFEFINKAGTWWTQAIDQGDTFLPFYFFLFHSSTVAVDNGVSDKRYGRSVRCFRPIPNE